MTIEEMIKARINDYNKRINKNTEMIDSDIEDQDKEMFADSTLNMMNEIRELEWVLDLIQSRTCETCKFCRQCRGIQDRFMPGVILCKNWQQK